LLQFLGGLRRHKLRIKVSCALYLVFTYLDRKKTSLQ